MNVWILLTSHRHGTDVSVHRTEDGARSALLGYVRQFWDDERINGEPVEQPEDADEAINRYFDTVTGGDEYYSIEQTELRP